MPQVIPIVAMAIANAIPGISALAVAAIGLASSLVAYALTPRPKPAQLEFSGFDGHALEKNGHLVNTRSTQDPLPILYGQSKAGGTQPFIEVSGTDNKYIHIVQTLCEGEVDSLVQLYLDDKTVEEYGFLVHYEFFNGSASQMPCATLAEACPSWSDALRHTCYVYVRLEFSEDKFNALPTITAVIKGRKVYDPRTGLTEWSDNPAICLYDFERSRRYGVGLDGAWWNTDSIIDAANWSDAKGYTMNAVILDREAAKDTAEKLLAGFRTAIRWNGYEFSLLPLDYDAPVLALTDDDLLDGSFSLSAPSIQQLPKTMRVKFPNKDSFYTVEDINIPMVNPIGSDLVDPPEHEMTLPGVNTYALAYELGAYFGDREIMNYTYRFASGPKAAVLEAGNMISCTFSKPGWVNKLVRVRDIGISGENIVTLQVVDEDALLYDREINVSTHAQYSTSLPDPLAVPGSVQGVTITEEIATNKSITYSRLRVQFTRPGSMWSHVEVHVKVGDSGTYEHYQDASGEFRIDPAEEGKVYYIKLLSVSILGKKQALADVPEYSKEVEGKKLPPGNVTSLSAMVTGEAATLRWSEVVDIDIAGYEVRDGAAFASGLPVAFVKATNTNIVGLKPGDHTLWIAAKDSVGLYSATPVSAALSMLLPGTMTETYSWLSEYDDGTHTNTDYMDDPTYGRVLYVDTGLSGSWLSPVHDLGSVLPVRWWLDFDYVLIGDETTWAGTYGASDAWTTHDAIWRSIFVPTASSGLSVSLLCSDDNANWTELPGFAMLSADIAARYVRYRVSISNESTSNIIYVKPSTLEGATWA